MPDRWEFQFGTADSVDTLDASDAPNRSDNKSAFELRTILETQIMISSH